MRISSQPFVLRLNILKRFSMNEKEHLLPMIRLEDPGEHSLHSSFIRGSLRKITFPRCLKGLGLFGILQEHFPRRLWSESYLTSSVRFGVMAIILVPPTIGVSYGFILGPGSIWFLWFSGLKRTLEWTGLELVRNVSPTMGIIHFVPIALIVRVWILVIGTFWGVVGNLIVVLNDGFWRWQDDRGITRELDERFFRGARAQGSRSLRE